MRIYVVVAQAKCDYTGQYGMECLACMSEYEFSDNPEYLIEHLEQAKSDSRIDRAEIVAIEVPSEKLKNQLYPSDAVVHAEVVEKA